jgi:sec-independent protein translocase protein TatA
MRSIGTSELLVILLVFLLLFGGSKLPGLAKGLGEGIKNFKKSVRDEEEAPSAEARKQDTAQKQEETQRT